MASPTKKIIPILIACAVAVTGIYFASAQKRSENIVTNSSSQKLTIESVEKSLKNGSNQDNDSDGLKNWEEVLWKTDPNNPDTDGDGAPDGDEVINNRNPTVKGPNDLLEKSIVEKIKAKAKVGAETEPATATDKFAIDLFSEYLRLKKDGALTEFTQEELIKNIVARDLPVTDVPKYTFASMNVTSSDSDEDIRRYGNELGSTIVRNTPPGPLQNELTIFFKAVQSGSEKDLQGLEPLSEGYKKIIADTLAMKVPKSAVQIHLDFANSAEKIALSIEEMKRYFKDPIVSVRGLANYNNRVNELAKAYQKMVAYFFEKGIIFDANEDGYRLIHGM